MFYFLRNRSRITLPMVKPPFLFASFTACERYLCARYLSYVSLSASFPKSCSLFGHRHTNFFTTHSFPFLLRSLLTYTSHCTLLHYISEFFILLLHTLDMTTSQHFIFTMQALLVCPFFHTLIKLLQFQHMSHILNPPPL